MRLLVPIRLAQTLQASSISSQYKGFYHFFSGLSNHTFFKKKPALLRLLHTGRGAQGMMSKSDPTRATST
jgi:hypothetical protein